MAMVVLSALQLYCCISVTDGAKWEGRRYLHQAVAALRCDRESTGSLPDNTVVDVESSRTALTVGHRSTSCRTRGAGPELHLYAFDLLTLRGTDLTREPLEERRGILRA